MSGAATGRPSGNDANRPGRTNGRGRLPTGIVICCASAFLINLDNTIVNVALPEIQRSLGADVPTLQWIVDVYLLTMAALLILAGSLGDRFGPKKVLVLGLVVFGVGSLLCGLSTSGSTLIAARFLQAIGGAMLNPNTKSIINAAARSSEEKARAFALWGVMVGLGMGCGPVIGGTIVQYLGWRGIFLINIPLVALFIWLARSYVAAPQPRSGRQFDPLGQILILGATTAGVFTIIEFPRAHTSTTAATSCVTVVFLIGFIVQECRAAFPLIDLKYFRSAPFSIGALICVFSYASFGGFIFVNTLRLQNAFGYSALVAGLLSAPMAALTMVGAYTSRRLARYSIFAPLLIAGVLISGAAGLSTWVWPAAPLVLVECSIILLGIGFGNVNSPLNILSMSGMPASESGVAGAITSSCAQFGQALGIAAVGALMASQSSAAHSPEVFAAANLAVWVLIAAFGIAVSALSLLASARAKMTITAPVHGGEMGCRSSRAQ